MMNKAQLIGNLGRDPEVRTLADGGKVTNLSVATTESWKDRDSGERRERTEWHRVSVWGEGPAKYLGYAEKGTLVLIEGKITTRKYTDNAGVEKYSTEIVVQGRGGQVQILARGVSRDETGRGSSDGDQASGYATGGANGSSGPRESYDLNDDIPF